MKLIVRAVFVLAIASTFLLSLSPALAQSIQFEESRKIWLLTTSQSSYAIGVSPDGSLQNLYWGAPLWRIADLPAAAQRRDISSFDPRQMLENEELPGWAGLVTLNPV